MNVTGDLPAPFHQQFQRFCQSEEVQSILRVAALWDGKTVRGDLVSQAVTVDLLTLATAYHREMGQYDRPYRGDVWDWPVDLRALTRGLWKPLREIVWPKRPTKSLPRAQQLIEQDDEWWWVAIDRQKWGILIDPQNPFQPPEISKISIDHSRVVRR